MKNVLCIIVLLISVLSKAYGQESSMPIPEFINIPYLFVEGSDKLLSLSKETANMPAKYKTVFWELAGTASKTRIKSSDKFVFVVKVGETDPMAILNLFKMEVTKKNRRAVMLTSPVWGHQIDNNSKDLLKYKVEKIYDKVYKIVPDSILTTGEYMFMNGMTPYSFGIE